MVWGPEEGFYLRPLILVTLADLNLTRRAPKVVAKSPKAVANAGKLKHTLPNVHRMSKAVATTTTTTTTTTASSKNSSLDLLASLMKDLLAAYAKRCATLPILANVTGNAKLRRRRSIMTRNFEGTAKTLPPPPHPLLHPLWMSPWSTLPLPMNQSHRLPTLGLPVPASNLSEHVYHFNPHPFLF